MVTPPPCVAPQVLPVSTDAAGGWRVDQPLLMRTASEGTVTSATLRLELAAGGAPVDRDVTADVVAFLDGTAPNAPWQVAVAADAAELSLCITPGPPPDILEVAP